MCTLSEMKAGAKSALQDCEQQFTDFMKDAKSKNDEAWTKKLQNVNGCKIQVYAVSKRSIAMIMQRGNTGNPPAGVPIKHDNAYHIFVDIDAALQAYPDLGDYWPLRFTCVHEYAHIVQADTLNDVLSDLISDKHNLIVGRYEKIGICAERELSERCANGFAYQWCVDEMRASSCPKQFLDALHCRQSCAFIHGQPWIMPNQTEYMARYPKVNFDKLKP